MRFARILLLIVLLSAGAGYFASAAGALGYEDEPCPLTDPVDHQLKVCHPDAQQGKPYSLQIKGKGGCTPDFVRYDVINGTLPPGLKVEPSTALVSGTPTQAGVFKFWLQISDLPQSWCADSKQSQWQFQITVDPSLHISPSTANLTAGQIGVGYNQQFTTSGGTASSWSSSGTMPAGLSLNTSTGLLSGTPTAAGTYTFAISASAGSASDTQHFTLVVVQPLKATVAAALAGEVGRPVQTSLGATGGQSPYTWSLSTGSNLPDGLTLSSAGAITGTPSAAGVVPVKVTVTDALGLTQTVDLRLIIAAKLTAVRRALPSVAVGHAYHARLTAIGGVAPRTWAIVSGKLPAGLRLNTRTGYITGSARKAGRARITISVTDKLGGTSTATYTLRVH